MIGFVTLATSLGGQVTKPIILDCMSLKYFDKVTQLISKFLVAPASL